ncbi:MAG: alkaline phosphatase family protein [Deltaproteobacteria bacterium]|nr:alkaline phosphatase family protein [Deltaproteobacteria bacterium]
MRLAALVFALTTIACNKQAVKLVAGSSDQKLRDRPAGAPQTSPAPPPILVLALDGMSRDLLYQELRDGKLPRMTELLGGDQLAHAYMDNSFLSTMPSTTMDAWVAAMTGRPPADTGVTGNEYFIREKRQFACPAPISFDDPAPTLSVYTEHYLDKLVEVPTVYERLREKEPHIQIWVVMNHLFRGADRMLLAKRTALVKAFEGFISKEVDEANAKPSPALFETLDSAAVDAVISHLKSDPLPDVMTVYLAGTDLYTHQAAEGPDEARRNYLEKVGDKQVGRIVDVLREKNRLDRTWVVVIADHGHSQVVHDKQHALGTAGLDAPAPTALKQAGFRIRPLKQNVDDKDPFSAVLAYGGATAYVYLADRSTCPGPKDVCAWDRMPRYEQDVLPAAEALHRGMANNLDMLLVRRPRPVGEIDRPFEVYVGGGKTMSIQEYLEAHPHPTYIDLEARLHDLSVGVHGERAGDIMLLAKFGEVDKPEDRFYFANLYRSWHGSPSKQDSEIPLIVANAHHTAAEIGPWVKHVISPRPYLQHLTDVILGLRAGGLGQ